MVGFGFALPVSEIIFENVKVLSTSEMPLGKMFIYAEFQNNIISTSKVSDFVVGMSAVCTFNPFWPIIEMPKLILL